MFGMNPKEIEKAMKKLGIKQETIEASEVIIKTKDKELVIRNPEIVKMNAMGQESLQITGKLEERSIGISEDDIKTVIEQAKVDYTTAKKALEKNKGDLAQTILELQKM